MLEDSINMNSFIFSLGVLIFETIFDFHPFYKNSIFELFII